LIYPTGEHTLEDKGKAPAGADIFNVVAGDIVNIDKGTLVAWRTASNGTGRCKSLKILLPLALITSSFECSLQLGLGSYYL